MERPPGVARTLPLDSWSATKKHVNLASPADSVIYVGSDISLHNLSSGVQPRAYKRREGMQLGKHQNSHVGGRMCMNAHVIDFY